MNIEETERKVAEAKAAEEAAKAEEVAETPKTEKPVVELFIMSHCPYGTQIEKGILPVLKLLGDKIDFQLKFVYYAMHKEEELNEQLNQYCVQKNEPGKLITYLENFLVAGDSKSAVAKSGINAGKLASCVRATDLEFDVIGQFKKGEESWGMRFPPFDVHKVENEKYGVGGSPTFVLNGKTLGVGRSSAQLLEAICTGFEVAPEECSTELSAAAPGAGFGFGGSAAAGTGDASCE